jgi:two-component system sensor histidine kinase BaeS
MIWREIQSNEQLVGYVGFRKLQRVDRQFDQAFEQQQKKSFALTALLMALFSGLLAVPLASRIVRPLLRVNNAVSEISEGNYAHRIVEKRKDEIGDLAANINQLGHTLEQNRDARQRWVAEISHELRTPLAVVNAEIEAMQDGIREPNASSLDSLHAEVANLGRIVEDLHTLSLSDVGALDYKMTPMNVSRLVTDFLDSNQSKLDAIPLSLTLHASTENTTVLADKLRLEQLLSNLLQNTLRYTHQNGTLEVSVVPDNDKLIVLWSDSAPGVSEDALTKLFDPLYRAEESRNRESGGAGLGLAIVAKIVEAHNGSISAQHSDKGGITIRVALPLHGGQA